MKRRQRADMVAALCGLVDIVVGGKTSTSCVSCFIYSLVHEYWNGEMFVDILVSVTFK